MRKHTRLAVIGLATALLLGAAVGTASARRLELSNTGIRVFFPALRFAQNGGGLEVVCPVTIEGTFHSRTISKVSGQLIGFITSARLTQNQCTYNGGVEEVIILNGNEGTTTTLPWHIRYDRFIGALPGITRIRLQLINVSFRLMAFGVGCLYKSTAARPAFGFAERLLESGQVTRITPDTSATIPLFEGSRLLCPGEGIFEGPGNVTLLGNTTLIFIRLVA